MIGAFRKVSLRHLQAQRTRTLLTVSGIALGVATMVSVRLMTEAMPRAYERMVDELAGKAQLQISNGEGGVPEELLEEVKKVPGVTRAVAAVNGFVSPATIPGEFLAIFGIDLLADRDVRDYEMVKTAERAGDPLAFLAQPDSVALTTEFLHRHDLKVGDRITVQAPAGPTDLTIRTALEVRSGPATLWGGRLALMDVFAAQAFFGLDRRFTQIDLVLDAGADVATVQRAAEKLVAGRGAVERPEVRGATLDRLLESVRTLSTLGAVAALVVGLYLIFNTMMVAVVQRRRELGILRALGMSRGEVISMVLIEALCLGIAGSALGVPIGVAFARLLGPVVAFGTFRTYFLSFDVPDVSIRVAPVAWGVALGVACAMLAAALPAREAVRVPPVESLRPAPIVTDRAGSYRRLALFGTALALLAVVLRFVGDESHLSPTALGAAVMTATGLGLVFIGPAVIRALTLRVETPLARLFGLTGTVASRNLVRHMGRVVITASAFSVSLGSALFVSTQITSFQQTIRDSIASYFSTLDLAIYLQNAPNAVATEMAALPAVESLGVVRSLKVAYDGSLVVLAARGVEPEDAALHRQRLESLMILDGDRPSILSRLAKGEGAIVNEAFELRFRKKPGDTLVLPTPNGDARLPVLATYFDGTAANMGVILIDRGLYRRLWHDDRVSLLEPRFRPGIDLEQATEEIRRRFGSRYSMFIFTLDEFRRETESQIERGFVIPFALILCSFAIALLGIVNSVFACVLDRVREIGVLRALGASRGQIAWSIMAESGAIGAMGGIFAATFGSLWSYFSLNVLYHWMLGLTVSYHFPAAATFLGCTAAIILAALAGYFPARRAARLEPTEALQYE